MLRQENGKASLEVADGTFVAGLIGEFYTGCPYFCCLLPLLCHYATHLRWIQELQDLRVCYTSKLEHRSRHRNEFIEDSSTKSLVKLMPQGEGPLSLYSPAENCGRCADFGATHIKSCCGLMFYDHRTGWDPSSRAAVGKSNRQSRQIIDQHTSCPTESRIILPVGLPATTCPPHVHHMLDSMVSAAKIGM